MIFNYIFIKNLLKKKLNVKNNSYGVSDGLFDGEVGISLSLFYRYKRSDNKDLYDSGFLMLDRVLENLQIKSTLGSMSLSEGLSGLGYMFVLLKDLDLLDMDIEELIPGFDDLIFEMTTGALEEKNLGFCNGLAGVLHYFNMRADSSGVNLQLVNGMIAATTNENNGFYFPEELIYLPKLGHTHSYVNLGMAHGVAGFLCTILNYYKINPLSHIKDYLYKALNFIISYQKEVCFSKGKFCHFPSFIRVAAFDYGDSVKEWDKSRLAWCIGDLNMAYLFTKAGQILNEEVFSIVGDVTGLTTTKRRSELETKICDPFLCHGSSGVAMVYNRLYEMTGADHYRTSYLHWLSVTNLYFEQKSQFDKSKAGLLNGRSGVDLFLSTQFSHTANHHSNTLFLI